MTDEYGHAFDVETVDEDSGSTNRRRFITLTAVAVLWMVAEKRFRKLNAPHLMTDEYAGERYEDGAPVEHRKKIAA